MHNPTGAFRLIKDHYIRYVRTSTATRFDGLERERADLLERDGVFYRQPWLEILPEYVSSGKTVKELTKEDCANQLTDNELHTFKNLVQRGLASGYELHSHQTDMLYATLNGQNSIITSGTGSGKTESFLLPLFAQLAKELTHWQKPNAQQQQDWWHRTVKIADDDGHLMPKYQQRAHENRPAAVRALILYPMNALVEDQLTRLRLALDSDEVREWLDHESNCKGNRIYFGRYNSSTPTAGKLTNDYKIKELRERLKEIEKNSREIEEHIAEYHDFDIKPAERRAFFPRTGGAEMLNRFDMQATPPDILITNFSMLSVMLMREVDETIFEKTRAWLAAEDLSQHEREEAKKDRIFHIIIDELHLYRGTAGTEVAYLLQLTLLRLGLHPEHPQLKIMASSASLEGTDEKSWDFISQFFGFKRESVKQKFSLIEGRNRPVSIVKDKVFLPIEPFIEIQKTFKTDNFHDASFQNACKTAAQVLVSEFGIVNKDTENDSHLMDDLTRLLHCFVHPALDLRARLYAPMLKNTEGSQNVNAIDTIVKLDTVCAFRSVENKDEKAYFSEKLFGKDLQNDDLKAGTEGVFILRSLLDTQKIKHDLPRFRCHYFFRNIEGLWASADATDIEPQYADADNRTAGRLYNQMRWRSAAGNRILELLYCDNCGTTLFGGSRSLIYGKDDARFEMLPLSPRIENVPEKTPAKFIEQRSYQEYAVFWAKGKQIFTKHDQEHAVPSDCWRQASLDENQFKQAKYDAIWQPASLNVQSGDVDWGFEKHEENPEKWVNGYVFRISDGNKDISTNDEHTHRALPCVCPNCGINYQLRSTQYKHSSTSPIRDFRRGFGKTVQLLAKELNHQLDAKNQKLVVFSDSREDAATIANDIERSHFNDLVRELLITELHESLLLSTDILNALTNEDTVKMDDFEKNHPIIFKELSELEALSRSRRSEDRTAAQNKLTAKTQGITSVTELVDKLIQRFIALGINPAGVNISNQQIKDAGGNEVAWYELFDFETNLWKTGTDAFKPLIKTGLLRELGSTFFGRLFYSLESSGLGYLTFDPSKTRIAQKYTANAAYTEGSFVEILNAIIRILGDKYYYVPTVFEGRNNLIDYSKLPAKVKNYVRAVVKKHGGDELTLGNAIHECLVEMGVLKDSGIQIEALFLRVAAAKDPFWTNKNDARAHLQPSANICTWTNKPLEKASQQVRDLWENNYISFHTAIQKRTPLRLRCEELTGQTDDQFERQRHFRKIILTKEGATKAREIDLLSVTTTLEVGVDIGALQAIMLANMPPQRFNYQQRVGRAGRRGQAFSIVLTFCRGRSHDEFYFNNPHRITSDPPPTPFLAMQQDRITRRLLAKEILRCVFLQLRLADNLEETNNVHGQFGKTADWKTHRLAVISWLQGHQETTVVDIVKALLPNELDKERPDKLVKWAINTEGSPNNSIHQNDESLLTKIDKIVGNTDWQVEDLAERLAEGGLLPMFGMPTTVKNLYHGIKKKGGHLKLQQIDRTNDLAIFEFAPNSQKTKDKAIHTSIGFTNDFRIGTEKGIYETVKVSETARPFSYEGWMFRCRSCGHLQTDEQAQNVTFLNCPTCETPVSKEQTFAIRSPQAYRTNLSKGKDRPEFSDIQLSRPPIFAEGNDGNSSQINEKKADGYTLSLSDYDRTWRVNTNGDNFFKGQLVKTRNVISTPSERFFIFQNQWITEGVEAETGFQFYGQNPDSNEPIALVASKNTEVLRLSPRLFSAALSLDMFKNGGQWAAVSIRSAFYSAAFLLQRTLADTLDIDPMEIAIADIRQVKINDYLKTAEIVLTDELPNGAGFVRHLFNNFDELTDKILYSNDKDDSYNAKIHYPIHSQNCLDACYECLKVFRNMNYHSLLDWRLGMALLRVLREPSYAVGADGKFDTTELMDWRDEAKRLRDTFIENFSTEDRTFVACNDLPIPAIWDITNPNDRTLILIVHPLWETDFRRLEEDAWITEIFFNALQMVGNNELRFKTLDTFNLHRRLGECYQKLYITHES
jgi:DEAD/DEAH box helicase domain-containing protein